jgi:hypothetical protein
MKRGVSSKGPNWADAPRTMLPLLRAALGAKPDASPALVIAKTHYEAVGGHRDVNEPERDLHRRLRRRNLVLLRAGAIVAS